MKSLLKLALISQAVFFFYFENGRAQTCAELFPQALKKGLYKVDSEGHPRGVQRIETLKGNAVRVIDVTGTVAEKTAKSDPTLNIFNLSDVFDEPVTLLGFGKPNVYLATTIPEGQSLDAQTSTSEAGEKPLDVKFAAKSLKRGDSLLVPTGGRLQSGILIVFKNLPEAIHRRLFESAKKHVGTRRWTCVNANCRVLQDAGFTMNGEPLDKYYFPTALLDGILKNGLRVDGQAVEFDIVRTTRDYLEDVGHSIEKSVANTPFRHALRAVAPLTERLRTNVYFVKFKNKMSDLFGIFTEGSQSELDSNTLETAQVRLPLKPDLATFSAEVSEPSKMGTILGLLWGPHTLFQVQVPESTVNKYLPGTLKAFPQQNPSFVTKLKKHFLFSKPVVQMLRSQLAARAKRFESLSEKDLYDMLRTDSAGIPNRYNFVVVGNSVIIMKIGIKLKFIDWILSKHVLVSGYSGDVRFAGEIWKSEDGTLHLNGNSGTYMPDEGRVIQAGDLVKELFPNIVFEIHPE